MNMSNHRLQGARLIDPSQTQLPETLHVRDGHFAAAPADEQANDTVIDGTGLLALPALIDLSLWFGQSDYRPPEAAADESAAAIAAGFGGVCLATDSTVWQSMRPVATETDLTQSDSMLDYLPIGPMSISAADDAGRMRTHGIRHLCNGLYNPGDKAELLSAFRAAAAHDMTVHSYIQDCELGRHGCVHDGMTAARLGLHPIPVVAETMELSRLLTMVEQTGARLHIKCVTSAAAVRQIETAKQSGLPVTADTSIAHLFLTEHDVSGFDSRCHVLPPLRSTEDRDSLIDAVRTGVIDAICSEHQPLNRDAKLAPFPSTEPGMSTLDVFLALGLRLIEDEVMTLEKWVELSHINPARILRLKSIGFSQGAQANYILVDPNLDFECIAETLTSSSPHCPFTGWNFNGRVVLSCLKGRRVFRREPA